VKRLLRKPTAIFNSGNRVLVAAVLAAVCVLCGGVAFNAYDAGHAEGFARGYGAASLHEWQAWLRVPKVCTPDEVAAFVRARDMQAECESWWFHHNPPVRETFKADPRQAK
jgi:hypothetical protein